MSERLIPPLDKRRRTRRGQVLKLSIAERLVRLTPTFSSPHYYDVIVKWSQITSSVSAVLWGGWRKCAYRQQCRGPGIEFLPDFSCRTALWKPEDWTQIKLFVALTPGHNITSIRIWMKGQKCKKSSSWSFHLRRRIVRSLTGKNI